MTFCDRCSTQLRDGSNYCSKCGGLLGETVATVQRGMKSPVIKRNTSIYAIISLIFGSMSLMGLISVFYIMDLIGASSDLVKSARVGWVFDNFIVLLPVFGILAIIFGIAGIKQIRNDSHLSGMNMTMAGLIMGAVITMISIWFCILLAGY